MSSWNLLREFLDNETHQAAEKAVKEKTVHSLMDEISVLCLANGNKQLGDFMKTVSQKVASMEKPTNGTPATKKVTPDMPAPGSAFAK